MFCQGLPLNFFNFFFHLFNIHPFFLSFLRLCSVKIEYLHFFVEICRDCLYNKERLQEWGVF